MPNSRKILIVSLSLISILITIQLTIERDTREKMLNIINNYEDIDKISITSHNEDVKAFTNKEEVEYLKRLFYPSVNIHSKKKIYQSNIEKRIFVIDFYINEKKLFTQEIFSLSENVVNNDELNKLTYFEIYGFSPYAIAKINKRYFYLDDINDRKLHLLLNK
ncbi:hypothetical protein ACLIA0_12330 [Bacillaceae bacterium W0354]